MTLREIICVFKFGKVEGYPFECLKECRYRKDCDETISEIKKLCEIEEKKAFKAGCKWERKMNKS